MKRIKKTNRVISSRIKTAIELMVRKMKKGIPGANLTHEQKIQVFQGNNQNLTKAQERYRRKIEMLAGQCPFPRQIFDSPIAMIFLEETRRLSKLTELNAKLKPKGNSIPLHKTRPYLRLVFGKFMNPAIRKGNTIVFCKGVLKDEVKKTKQPFEFQVRIPADPCRQPKIIIKVHANKQKAVSFEKPISLQRFIEMVEKDIQKPK